MSKEYLLGQIAVKAEEEAQAIVGSALDVAAKRKEKAEAELKEEYERKIVRANEEAEQALAGRKTLSRIDAKKTELNVKRELIDEVYRAVTEKINSLGDKDYLKFMAGLIGKYAEEGDEVIICKKDERRITSAWLSDVAFDLQLSLKLSNQFHDDIGGIILRGAKYDKNLTVSSIVNEARTGTESTVADRLFG